MRKTLKRIASGVMAVATASTMLLSVAPVSAASPSTLKDTLSREKISVASTHAVAATGVPTWGNGESLVFDYGPGGFTLTAGALAGCSITVGTCSSTVSSTNTLVVTCTGAAGCSGTLGFGANTFSGTNPGTTGSKAVTLTSNAGSGVTGGFSIPIVDDDQVAVTATVAAAITFDIDTQASANALPNTTESAAPYSVALGTVTTSDTRVSGTTDAVNYIMLDLDSNASNGTVITVKNLNGANGLKSTSVPADDIDSATGAVSDGVENYGICSVGESATTGALDDLAPFDGACTGNTEGNTVGGFDGTSQPIYDTNDAAISVGRAMIAVQASINTLTAAHNDYTDTLTFIATGTF